MAKIHRSKDHLGADVRRIRRRYALGWVGRIAVMLLLVACYVLLWDILRGWGATLAEKYHAWAVKPLLTQTAATDVWESGLQRAWRIVVQSGEVAVSLSPLLIPAFLGGVVLWICSRLMADKQSETFGALRSGMEGEHYALTLARQMNRDCHVFVNKNIPHDGQWSETDMIVVGPGGVALVEVKNWMGTVQGDVTDEQVSRGGGKTHYNPVRQVGTHVYRLKHYLQSKGIHDVWVVPCVLFVHPKAQVRITGSAASYSHDERGTVVLTAPQFRERLMRPMERGHVLSREQVRSIVQAIQAAPAKKTDG